MFVIINRYLDVPVSPPLRETLDDRVPKRIGVALDTVLSQKRVRTGQFGVYIVLGIGFELGKHPSRYRDRKDGCAGGLGRLSGSASIVAMICRRLL